MCLQDTLHIRDVDVDEHTRMLDVSVDTGMCLCINVMHVSRRVTL